MYRVSYRTRFRVRPDEIKEAELQARELFRLWEEHVDTENMEMAFDPVSGWFAFDTGGDCQCPPWLTDDTPLLLRSLGHMSMGGAMVYHSKGGEPYDFPVGPNVLSKQQTLEMEKIQRAHSALVDVRPLVPEDAQAAIDKALGVLHDLRM